jgi:hypothetical protein
MKEDRGPWYLFTGLVIGLVIGIIYAWRIAPVEYVDTSPSMFKGEYKDQYRALIAAAFASDGNLPRAQKRLIEVLGDEDPARELTLQAQRALVEGRPQSEARALGLLAVALSQGNTVGVNLPPAATLTNTPAPPTSTIAPQPTVTASRTGTSVVRTAGPTLTPLPTRTPTPTAGAPYVIQGEPEPVCDVDNSQPLLIVEIYDASGQQVPGVEVIVSWDGGEQHFYTGLKPERGLGYADFLMQPEIEYSVSTAGGGETITGLMPRECTTASGNTYWGTWKITYVQP